MQRLKKNSRQKLARKKSSQKSKRGSGKRGRASNDSGRGAKRGRGGKRGRGAKSSRENTESKSYSEKDSHSDNYRTSNPPNNGASQNFRSEYGRNNPNFRTDHPNVPLPNQFFSPQNTVPQYMTFVPPQAPVVQMNSLLSVTFDVFQTPSGQMAVQISVAHNHHGWYGPLNQTFVCRDILHATTIVQQFVNMYF